MAEYDQQRLNEELARLRRNGLVMPRHSGRAAQSYGEAVVQTRAIQKAAGVGLENLSYSMGRPIVGGEDLESPEVQRMLKENQAKINAMDQKRTLSHRGMRRTSASVVPSGTDAQNAIPRFYSSGQLDVGWGHILIQRDLNESRKELAKAFKEHSDATS